MSSTYHRSWVGKYSNNSLWNKDTEGKQRRKNKRKVLWVLLDGFTLGKYLQSQLSLSLRECWNVKAFPHPPSLLLLPLSRKQLGVHSVLNPPAEKWTFESILWLFFPTHNLPSKWPGDFLDRTVWYFESYVERGQLRLKLHKKVTSTFFPIWTEENNFNSQKAIGRLISCWKRKSGIG